MTIDIIPSMNKEVPSELQIGAFTFEREQNGHIVLHVDVDSGLYPMRLTDKQTSTLTRWLLALEANERTE